MPQTISDVDTLQRYISGVMRKAEHHAHTVDEICLAIAGAVVWRHEGELECRTHKGELANMLWFEVNGKRYALKYNPAGREIQLLEGGLKGELRAAFTNDNTAAEVKRVFEEL